MKTIIKRGCWLLAVSCWLLPLEMKAQNKLFTLEDLNFGGTNYHNMQPENMFLTWWGDQLVQTDVEKCHLIDVKTGKKTKLFTLDDINRWADSNEDENRYVRHLTNATFPTLTSLWWLLAISNLSSCWTSRPTTSCGRTVSRDRRPTTGVLCRGQQPT